MTISPLPLEFQAPVNPFPTKIQPVRQVPKRRRGLIQRIFIVISCGLVLTGNLAWADSLDDWADVYLRALKAENTAPPLGSRNTAIFAVAVADAVNAIEHHWRPFLFDEHGPSNADAEAAIAAAAHDVGVVLFPSRRADFEALWLRATTNGTLSPSREAGFRLGHASAARHLEARASDGSNTQVPYIPTNAPGAWRRTAPYFRPPDLPHWYLVKPFTLTNAAQFRPPGPPALASRRFAEDRDQTRSLGGKLSTIRTADQTEAARFWSDFTGTVTPPGHWTQITLDLARSNHLTLVEKVRLLALVHLALADAGIACWDAKFAYNFWRPITAIRYRAEGISATEVDPRWEPLITTPSFPEYVSGHSTFSGAAGEVLRRRFGRDQFKFSVRSDTVPGVTRSFESLTAVVEEIGMSRIWGGIHFRSADVDGQALGRKIGDWVFDHALQAQ